jgi:hypothetical protein
MHGADPCLTCHQSTSVNRGCCTRCIMRHRRAVVAWNTTWAELERRGSGRTGAGEGGGVAGAMWPMSSHEPK